MKILSEQEKQEHRNFVLLQGAKGCLIGAGIAFGLTKFMKYRYPVGFSQMNTSIKTAMWAMPIITLGAFFADEGSLKFDEDTYRTDYFKKQAAEKLELYNKLSTQDRILHQLNENKYSIVVGAWAASLYGSWRLVNKDAYMTKAQKLVQARVYAQAFTVVLLLATILLSVHEAELQKKQPAPVPEWKKYLEEHDQISTATPQPHVK